MDVTTRWLRPAGAALGAVFVLLGCGCSSLTPQIFSDRLIAEPASDAGTDVTKKGPPATFDEAYADAALVQRRYVTAVRDQGNATPALSAGLIGLSAVTLFKAVTGANTRDMAGAGVLGAAAWAYGTNTDSKARRDVYRAGAEALSCAMLAVEPLRKGQTSLGKATDTASENTLYGRSAAVRLALSNLSALREQHAALKQPLLVATAAEPQKCTRQKVPAACAIPGGATADERAALEAACKRQPPRIEQRCTPGRPAGTREVAANPAVLTAFASADTEAKAAQRELRAAQRVIGMLEEAGPALWKKSVQIQLSVSTEVEKTVPDLASVLAAGQGMRSVALGITGLEAFKPPEAKVPVGAAEGEEDVRALASNDREALAALDAAVAALRQARTRLDDLVSGSVGAGHADVRKALNECSVKLTGVKLLVTPAGDNISVALGATQSFFVSGGTGAPSGAIVSGAKVGPLPMRIDGGQIFFDYKAEGVAAGDSVILRFTDGARPAGHRDRKSTRLNSSHTLASRMPSSA